MWEKTFLSRVLRRLRYTTAIDEYLKTKNNIQKYTQILSKNTIINTFRLQIEPHTRVCVHSLFIAEQLWGHLSQKNIFSKKLFPFRYINCFEKKWQNKLI